jgi:hypothetical protein
MRGSWASPGSSGSPSSDSFRKPASTWQAASCGRDDAVVAPFAKGNGLVDVVNLDLMSAREDIRREQASWAGPTTPPETDALGAALNYLAQRRKQEPVDGVVSDGWFRYDAANEQLRWDRTEAVLRRVDPGPYEDPRYIEMLARQAASIELFIPDGPLDTGRVLLGTTGAARNHASTELSHGYAVILMSAGMIECLYQMAKCVTLTYVRKEMPDGRGVSFSVDPDVIADHLRTDSSAVDLMADNLTSWIYDGVPRSSTSKMPAPELHGALQLLINGAERFVIAHEYAHAFVDVLDTSDPLPPHECELRADALALMLTRNSAAALDRLPANMALSGAVLAMKANQLIDLALSIARTGMPTAPVSLTHPPFETRLALLEQGYLSGRDDLEVARDEMRGMQVPAMLGDMVFATVYPRLVSMYQSGEQLHPIWG